MYGINFKSYEKRINVIKYNYQIPKYFYAEREDKRNAFLTL